jgi:glyoxylase-like metal-dependent hydrolase (beta-lactamase superfamily II)
MRFFIRVILLCVAAAALATPRLHAQFGPPEPQGEGPKLSPPTAFPPSGTFPTTESVTLLNEDPKATIHYTLDGSAPTSKSPVYDPLQVLFIGGIYEGEHGLKSGYTIRAVAMREGRTNSDIANFAYVVDRRDHTAYVSEEVLPGVRMIRDSDNDKMFLIKGSKKFALVDSGMGQGELQKYISQFTAGLPVEPIFTHNHFDHIGQADQFIRDSVEHIGEADRPAAEKLLKSRGIPDEVIAKNLLSAHDGDRIDLGDRSLVIYAAPGHTPGSLVVFDEQTGNLFTGDSFGSNSPTIPDALWMQFTQTPLDVYLSTINNCRANFSGKVKFLMTGHNDRPLEGETYLNNLQSAVQSLMDKGDSVLVPSYRPTGLQQVVVGDRFHDVNWVAINVNKAHYLPAPVEKIAGLTRISVDGLKLSPVFTPTGKEYEVTVPHGIFSLTVSAEPTSTRSSALTINGEAVKPGEQHKIPLTKSLSAVTIRVASPDGTESAEYTVKLAKQ